MIYSSNSVEQVCCNAQVYKAQRPDGQEVAVKVLHNADKVRLQMFAMVWPIAWLVKLICVCEHKIQACNNFVINAPSAAADSMQT